MNRKIIIIQLKKCVLKYEKIMEVNIVSKLEIKDIKELQKKLGINDWREFKPAEMLPKLISFYPNTNTEVLIESFKQFPDLARLIANYFSEQRKENENILDKNNEESKNVLETYDVIIDVLKTKLTEEDISFEEAKYYIEKMQDIVREKQIVHIQDQKFFERIKQYGLAGGIIGLAVALVALGNKVDFSQLVKKNN